MLKKISSCVLLTCALVAGSADSAYAQRTAGVFGARRSAPQTINFTLGIFYPRGEDGRVDDDVLNVNRFDPQFLEFDISDFKGATFGAEWLFPVGNFVEIGAGLAFSSKTVPTVYGELLDSDGSEIDQDLHLRIMPIAFTARMLPMGQQSPLQPYFGGGLGIFRWKYQETGEFVDFVVDDCTAPGANCPIFSPDPPDQFTGTGTDLGVVLLAGVRYAADAFTVGGEFRHHIATGDLSPDDFLGTKIDLGGSVLQFTVGVRF